MFKSIKKSIALCVGLVLLSSTQVCSAGIVASGQMLTPEYWIQQNPNANSVILDGKGITDLNARIIKESPTVFDMANYPATIPGIKIKPLISDYSILEDDLYLRGVKVSDNYKNILRAQTNVAAIPGTINVQYGVIIRRCPVRNVPTGEASFYDSDDIDFDAFQETMLDPGEPVAILHQSQNGYFFYIQARNYKGWINRGNVGLTDRKNWMEYVNPKNFLVVTDKNLTLKVGAEQVLYQQGSVLPIVKEVPEYRTVSAPARDKNGRLVKEPVNILKTNTKVNKGFLPYTSANLIKSAFKFYNAPYGWGGLKDSVDCSSLVFNVYRTVGIYLPRNADEQEATAGAIVNLNGMDMSQRNVQISALTPGAALAMPNHIMVYLGQNNDDAYAIHSLGSHVENGERKVIMKVVVSDLKLKRSDGASFLAHMTSACEYR